MLLETAGGVRAQAGGILVLPVPGSGREGLCRYSGALVQRETPSAVQVQTLAQGSELRAACTGMSSNPSQSITALFFFLTGRV